jgi:hypothetical protein
VSLLENCERDRRNSKLQDCATCPLQDCATCPLQDCATCPLQDCATCALQDVATCALQDCATCAFPRTGQREFRILSPFVGARGPGEQFEPPRASSG